MIFNWHVGITLSYSLANCYQSCYWYIFIFSISFHYSLNDVVLHYRQHFNTYAGLHDSLSVLLAAHYFAGISRLVLNVDEYVK